MTEQQALHFAQRIWGKHAWAKVNRSFRINDKAGPDGYVIPTGPITSYTIGYRRKGKYGGHYLSTQKGRGTPEEGFVGAFENALAECKGTRAGEKLAQLIDEIRSC